MSFNPQFDHRESIFLNEKYSDCQVYVKDHCLSAIFPCHKSILASASAVFDEMIEKETKEKKCVILIENIGTDLVYNVLQYVYIKNISFCGWENANSILKIAAKYKIKGLIQECENYLVDAITLKNVVHILEAAVSSQSDKLKNQCMYVCFLRFFKIVKAEEFKKASLEVIKLILSKKDQKVENEFVCFNELWKWATYNCCKKLKMVCEENIANEMSTLVNFIKFESMSQEELKCVPEAIIKLVNPPYPNGEKRKSCSE